ncbi:MAG: hypothetical protein GXP16_17220, partial [Gammaproteobacteria bacterium]|nr:hypothetical protein [Gammaproteobacteria bacterium]
CKLRGGEYAIHEESSTAFSLRVWLGRAEQGDAEAQTRVGEIFEQGLGTTPDFTVAKLWYEKAANQDYTRAQVNLGHIYERGLGVEPNPSMALTWYRRAAGAIGNIEIEPSLNIAPEVQVQRKEYDDLANKLFQVQLENQQLQRQMEFSQLQAADEQGDTSQQLAILQEKLEQRAANISALETRLSTVQDFADAQARLHKTREQVLTSQVEQVSESKNISVTQLSEKAQSLSVALEQIATLEKQINLQPPKESFPSLKNVDSVAGPSITIIQPSLKFDTRGLLKVTVGTATASEYVVGRVVAPAGLLALGMNGREITPNANGVFRTAILSGDSKSTITIQAVDRLGKKGELKFNIQTNKSDGEEAQNSSSPDPQLPDIDFGNFHALLIGNDQYETLPQLKTPIEDVRQIALILRTQYGFSTTVLENANRYETLSAFNEMRETLTSNDNLLVYYAGHGELDRTNMRGHWLPVDAELNNTANWLSNIDVTDILNVMAAKQIMLVVDSCYSGSLTRSSLTRLKYGMTDTERNTWLNMLAKKRSRVVLSSGGLAPVLDFGGGAHSVFAKSFIESLQNNNNLLLGQTIHQEVAARVAHAASGYDFEQIPQYAPINRAGHEAGDFIFVPTQ